MVVQDFKVFYFEWRHL